jgi:hypothetical protein
MGSKMNVGDRCQYISGDMFREVPSAHAYITKLNLHDWKDGECVKILSNIHNGSADGGRVFIVKHLVLYPNTSHFSKLFDIHMICWGSGRERAVEEYSALFQQSGWNYVRSFTQKKD